MSRVIKPVVSTLTSCYKGERYLETFLRELPKQTISDRMQVVFVHNEPSDKELELVDRFCQEYPGILEHIVVEKVEKMAASWNRAIKLSKADLVTIWNIDDLRVPNSLELQTKFLLENQEYDLCFGNFTIVNQFGSFVGKAIDHTPWFERKEELRRSMILGPFFMFRKSICDNKIGYFDEQFNVAMDFDFAIRVEDSCKIGMLKENLGYFLNEGKGASTRGDNIQPVERTVVEMRYGIFDKIESQWLPEALRKYKIRFVKAFGNVKKVEELLSSDYENYLRQNNQRESE